MRSERLKDFLIGLGFVAVQLVMFRHLKIFQTQPDLVLIYILWIMARRDRTNTILIAASLGFVQDALLDLWGLNMFAKTVIAFGAYNYIPKSSDIRLLLGQIFLLVLIVSLVHNLIFLALNGLVAGYSGELLFWRKWIGNSLYTATIASVIYLFRSN